MDATISSRIKKMSPQFLVTDINQSIEFYKKLSFELDFIYEDFYAGIVKDGHSIHLKLGRPSIEERKSKRNNEDLDLVLSVNDIEDLYEELLSKCIDIIQPLRDAPYGKEFYVADPDGYIIGYLAES